MSAALTPGFYEVPEGSLPTVVTHLEMRERAALRPVPAPEGLEFARVAQPVDLAFYRDLFTRVGAQDYLWISRLKMSDDELGAILNDPGVHLYTLRKDGQAEAILELDFRVAGECELAFFGLTPALIGAGAGRYLMNKAIELAYGAPIERFHVHTCTLDSAGALDFYRRSGFTPIRRQIEIMPDPRADGDLPRDWGPQHPIL